MRGARRGIIKDMSLAQRSWIRYTYIGANLLLAAACALYAADPEIISIPSKDLYPESITSTANGSIIIGSYGTSSVWRIPAGQKTAAKWFDTTAKGSLLGVFADEKAGVLLVCQGGVRTYDLKTGALKDTLTIPTATQFCNDLAVRKNGDVFVSDTTGAKIFVFHKGEKAAVEVASDPLLGGVDGLAFLDNQDQLFANTVTTNKMLRLDLAKDGKVTKITDLKQSRPLQGPDGMRAIDGKRLIIAEGAGRAAMGVPNGDSIEISTLKEGGMEGGTPAITFTKGWGYAMEGKLKQKGKTQDASPFRLFPIPVPKK